MSWIFIGVLAVYVMCVGYYAARRNGELADLLLTAEGDLQRERLRTRQAERDLRDGLGPILDCLEAVRRKLEERDIEIKALGVPIDGLGAVVTAVRLNDQRFVSNPVPTHPTLVRVLGIEVQPSVQPGHLLVTVHGPHCSLELGEVSA